MTVVESVKSAVGLADTQATREEMSAARLPLQYRDSCAHLLIPLNRCRQQEWYLPWKCEDERHSYEKCQYEEFKKRVAKMDELRAAKNAPNSVVQTYIPAVKMHFLLLIAALAIIGAVATRRLITERQFRRQYGCQPIARSYSKEPFLGLDTIPDTIRHVRKHKILERGCEIFRTYGNTFTLKELQRSAIMTIEPENIKAILSLKFKDYGISHRLEPFKPLLGEGIFDTDGEHWASSRALIRPSFARDQVADLTSLEGLIQDLFALLPCDGKTVVDLQDLFFRYTIDSATDFLFGQSVGTLKKSQSELGFVEAFNYAQKAVIMRGMLGRLSMFYRDRKADDSYRICRNFVQQFVDEAFYAAEVKKEQTGKEEPYQEAKRQKRIFSHELAWRTSDKRRVLDELMNVLLAGRDTTASLLGNLFFMLAKNPAIWEKLRSEVAFLQGRTPTYEELRCLKYVQSCVNESLRLHPVVPRNQREALVDTVLPLGGGKDGLSPVFVPKGTMVCYNVYVMHRRVDFYGPDAEEFRPERWMDGKLQPRWGYLPFNGGPRICIGQRYALTEVSYVLVRMAQKFRILQSMDPGPWEEALALTLCSRNGARVCLTPA
ncbi:N-alkane-inducible cytochrome P450 [Aspergillus mulundensis]|uniref:N-alkane-inducible cytochrome P450 n=1 Tax=Aspergillus mulundensis TaxID=1810919 RepID=A0A3D8SM78_9EURO|nr:N-alkane-inducible cytochrome P450 [Aspergillus mulundensis]RDW86908.1 N-alkane-inducible cytochrome P450 [Aspergillus mulundensis]